MAKRVYFVGDAQGAWTDTDFWPDGVSLDMDVIEEAKPVRAGDLNLIQQNAQIQLRDRIRQLISSGWTTAAPFLFGTTVVNGVSSPLPANAFAMGESWFNGSGQFCHVGNPDVAEDHQPHYSVVALPGPPTNGVATDFVYLEFWVQEVAAVGSTDTGGTNVTDRTLPKWGGVANAVYANQIWWSVMAVEPVRYFQLRWAIRVVRGISTLVGQGAQAGSSAPEGSYPFGTDETFVDGAGVTQTPLYVAGDGGSTAAQNLHCVDGYVYATPIASIARQAGVSTIASSALTDLRVIAQLNTQIRISQTNIYPTITNDSDLDHLEPVKFLWQGAAVYAYTATTFANNTASTAASLTTADLSQVSYAAKFLVPNLAGSGDPDIGSATSYGIDRVTLTLSATGSGADVVVELHADGGSVPGALISSGTIPASWIDFATARTVSCYLPGANTVNAGSAYWIVVKKAGTGGNHAFLQTLTRGDGTQNFQTSGDGTSWAAGNAFYFGLYTGTAGDPVFVYVNNEQLWYFEYDSSGNVVNIGELYTPPAPATRRDSYRTVSYGASGNPAGIQ